MFQVSFVVIAFNESAGIQKCIQSILNQKTNVDFEIILVDDGSTDKTAEIVKQTFGNNVLVLSQKNSGRGQARFNGIQVAKAPLIAMVDGDIELPEIWLETCIANLGDFSAVGGIAVPDGDCSTIHRLLSLETKVKNASIEVAGSNALIIKSALFEIGDSWVTPLGEDFRLNQLMRMKNHQMSCISSLVVVHSENKSYLATVRWLMISGIDASKLALRFKKFRTPDLAFIVWIIALLFAVVSFSGFHSFIGVLLLFLSTILISGLHFCSKFKAFKTPLRSIIGILLNVPLITSYLIGRFFGLFLITLKK